MKKLFASFVFFATVNASAQTLFTYGKEAVSVNDFVKAFKKNSSSSKDEKALREYLDLYISSRLKIKHARDIKLDTTAQFRSEFSNLRQQILPGYLNDPSQIQTLVDEAFRRSQKDIHVAHIFISFKSGSEADKSEAKKKLNAVTSELKKGISIDKLAQEYSDDPTAKHSGASLGWITAFSLPYELENVVYSTPVGKVSTPFESNAGYHIFLNRAERKAAGRIKAAEILLAFPDASEATREIIKRRTDSIYNSLLKGSEFGEMAAQFSNDVVSAASGGAMIEFGIGEYEPTFENIVYDLKEGEISKPFLTSHGYHIVKLLQKVPVASNKMDAATMKHLEEKVKGSDRMRAIKKSIGENVLSKTSVKESFKEKELWIYSDSLLDFKNSSTPISIKAETVIFQIDNKKYYPQDWLQFAQVNRFKADGSGAKPYAQMWKEFKLAKAVDYYEENLEKFNQEFRKQMDEFTEGNLFFEVMQKKVWTPAQKDTIALLIYYEKNKKKYTWNQSADAVVFTAPNAGAASHFIGHLGSPSAWKQAVSGHGDVSADSSRFEWSQIPGATKDNFKEGAITTFVTNKDDGTTTFAFILKTYPQPQQLSFTQAKGMVINDYQNAIEQEWLSQLRKKYPVVVNQKVLNDLVKSDKWK